MYHAISASTCDSHSYTPPTTLHILSPWLVQAEAEALVDLVKEFPSQSATLCFTCKVEGCARSHAVPVYMC